MLQRIAELPQRAALRLKVSSALHSLLWLSATASPACLLAASRFDDGIRVVIVCVGLAPILLTCGAYIFLMFKDRDRLHSEDYQIRKMALELIEEKGGAIPIEATSVQAIANPDYPRLSNQTDEP